MVGNPRTRAQVFLSQTLTYVLHSWSPRLPSYQATAIPNMPPSTAHPWYWSMLLPTTSTRGGSTGTSMTDSQANLILSKISGSQLMQSHGTTRSNFFQICIGPNPTWLVFLSQKETGREKNHQGFPRGSVIKTPPAIAGDVDLIPDPGRSHIPGATKPTRHNYWVSALEPEPNYRGLRASGPGRHRGRRHSEKPGTAARELPLTTATRGPAQPKINRWAF